MARLDPRRGLYWLLAVSFTAKLLYVFLLTDYSNYLFSDFDGYWQRALDRLAGNDFDGRQWAIWPPLPHIVLSWLFTVIDAFDLAAYRLEIVLGLNVLLSTINVACTYGIALTLVASSRIALWVAAVLACFFPLAYLNAFVMSEHPATTALLAAIWLLVKYPAHRGVLFCAGSLLAVATGLRPAFGLVAVPCGLYALFGNPFARISILGAASFSLGFVLIVAAVSAEVARISGGEVRGLSANGGVNFYFAQCGTHEVTARLGPEQYVLVPPATVQHPENGRVESPRPFHDQDFFATLGWRCARAQPNWAWTNLRKFRDLVFGPLLPSVTSAHGFMELLPIFRWLALGMLAMLPVGILVARLSRRRAGALLVAGIVLVSLLTQFVFNAEHRYLYPLIPLLIVLDAWVVMSVYRGWPDLRRKVTVLCVGLAGLVLAAGAYAAGQRFGTHTLIQANWARSLASTSSGTRSGAFAVDTLRFPEGERLRHVRRGLIDLPDPAHIAIEFRTCLQVDVPDRFEFVVASDDGFELRIDDALVSSHRAPRSYAATRSTVRLARGLHRFSLLYFQETGRLGVAAVWRRSIEGDQIMPAVGLRDVGIGSAGLSFLPPDRCTDEPR